MLVARSAGLEIDNLDTVPRELNAIQDAEEWQSGMCEPHFGYRALTFEEGIHVSGSRRRALGGQSSDLTIGLVWAPV